LGKSKETDLHAHPPVYASNDNAKNQKITPKNSNNFVRINGIDNCRGKHIGTVFPAPIFEKTSLTKVSYS